MHDRQAIRTQHDDGGTIRGVARSVGASRNAVRRALAPGARDRYHRASLTDDAEPGVRDVLADYPLMAVEDIAVLIDWRHARRTLSNLVARLRPEYAPEPGISARSLASIQTGSVSAGSLQVGELAVGDLVVGEVVW